MSIDIYNKTAFEINGWDFECTNLLPQMEEKDCYLVNEHKTREQLNDLVGNAFQEGWQLYTDKMTVSATLNPSGETPLLEAEFYSADCSLKIKLLHDDVYLVCRCSKDDLKCDNQKHFANCAYYEQKVMVRRNMRQKNRDCVVYGFWYQQIQGRWQPLAQQFLGFEEGKND